MQHYRIVRFGCARTSYLHLPHSLTLSSLGICLSISMPRTNIFAMCRSEAMIGRVSLDGWMDGWDGF